MAVAQRQRQAFALAQGMQVKAVTLVARTDRINVRLLSKRASNTFDRGNMISDSSRHALEGKYNPAAVYYGVVVFVFSR